MPSTAFCLSSSSGGELLVSLAEMLVVGGDHLSHLDERRADQATAALRSTAEVPAPTTAGQLLRRFSKRQCEAAVAAMAQLGNQVDRQLGISVGASVTLDMDSSDSEVYGRHKQGAAYNYQGQLAYDSQMATWAVRRRVQAVELRSGNSTEHPTAIRLLRRALLTLVAQSPPASTRLPGAGLVHLGTDGAHLDQIGGSSCHPLDELSNGTILCYTGGWPRSYEVRTESGQVIWQQDLFGGFYYNPALSPDGRRIAVENTLFTQGATPASVARQSAPQLPTQAQGWVTANMLAVQANSTGTLQLVDVTDLQRPRDTGLKGTFVGSL